MTFETLCRAHLKEFAKGAEKYAVESKLARRVNAWQDKVAQVIKNEENRPEFDIQTYRRNMINSMEREVQLNKVATKSFRSVVSSFILTYGLWKRVWVAQYHLHI